VHHGRHNPRSVAEATAPLAEVQSVAMLSQGESSQTDGTAAPATATAVLTEREAGRYEPTDGAGDGAAASRAESDGDAGEQGDDVPQPRWNDAVTDNSPGRVVREKVHPADPMTVDQALYEMELVGHDFYLFADAESGRPSVVYRRKGFDYGVIRLA
jgi:hypothetical protein